MGTAIMTVRPRESTEFSDEWAIGSGGRFTVLDWTSTSRRVRSVGSRRSKAELRAAYEAAANDVAFMAEAEELSKAFDSTVGDGLTD